MEGKGRHVGLAEASAPLAKREEGDSDFGKTGRGGGEQARGAVLADLVSMWGDRRTASIRPDDRRIAGRTKHSGFGFSGARIA